MKFSHVVSPTTSIVFGGSVVQSVNSHKHLGVTLSKDLKWAEHIDDIVRNASKKLGLLKRQSRWLSFEQKSTIYLSVIRPAIEYASVLYGGGTVLDELRLE